VQVFVCIKIHRGDDSILFRADPSWMKGSSWRDFCEVLYADGSTRFGECHGFFRVEAQCSKSFSMIVYMTQVEKALFAVVMELEPVSVRPPRDTMPGFGRFPFAAHKPRTQKKRSRRDRGSLAPKPVFTVINTDAINNSAFIVPDFDSNSAMGTVTLYWSVPPIEDWVEY